MEELDDEASKWIDKAMKAGANSDRHIPGEWSKAQIKALELLSVRISKNTEKLTEVDERLTHLNNNLSEHSWRTKVHSWALIFLTGVLALLAAIDILIRLGVSIEI